MNPRRARGRWRRRAPRALALLLAVTALASCSSSASSSSSTSSTPKTTYYVSLGDSFAVGVQPNAAGQSVPTDQGYADDLYNAVRPSMLGLQLVKLGCSGETTTTAMRGGICHYAEGSQVAAATAFIRAHQGSIAFVTIELGANNFEGCVAGGVVNEACVIDQVDVVEKELPQIFQQIRAAGGSPLHIVGMNLFDPFLVEWFSQPTGPQQAQQSVDLLRDFNRSLAQTHRANGARTANVANAFSSYAAFTDTTDLAGHQVPVSVARICQWTWACTPAPQGPNEHPNAEGYQQIANTFKPLVD